MHRSLRLFVTLIAFALCVGCVHTVFRILDAQMEPLPSLEKSVEGRIQNIESVDAPMIDPVVAGGVRVSSQGREWSAQLGLTRVRLVDPQGDVVLVDLGDPFANWFGLMVEEEWHPRRDLLPEPTNTLVPLPKDAEPPFHVKSIGLYTDDVLLVEKRDDEWGRVFVGGREKVARLQQQGTARMQSIALIFSVLAIVALIATMVFGRGLRQQTKPEDSLA